MGGASQAIDHGNAGMGDECDATSFLAAGTGLPVRSELGVGNVIFPVAYQVNSNLTVGATLKFLWSSLDMQMAGTVDSLSPIVTGGSGNLAMGFAMAPAGTPARIDCHRQQRLHRRCQGDWIWCGSGCLLQDLSRRGARRFLLVQERFG